ncbi:hypothetical protein ILUMI_01335 [Ignelater luminosus]|uniref:Peptidase S1 domain-containing protein n=1 Tax=Ignelater luminosus TaxID=2038154 RepID=A0A8K0GLT7_IGNLU|nr:hypothetical protein ILUMI_01335 [Ignelater luminosus]
MRLLRLKKPVTYTDYVRPICLPLNESQRAKVNETLYTSGWGTPAFNISGRAVKKRFAHTLQSIMLKGDNTTQMCFSPQNENNTVCQGDDGGPLMYSRRKKWFVEGIANTEDTKFSCNNPNEEACATRITPVNIEWILLNMEP